MVTLYPLLISSFPKDAEMIPFPKEDVTPPVTKMYFLGEILTTIYQFNCCQKYYFKSIIPNLIKNILKVNKKREVLECNICSNTRHNWQLIYSFVFYSIKIQDILSIIYISKTCTNIQIRFFSNFYSF